ncbi:unnamed protein product [Absidia cylindrospora]
MTKGKELNLKKTIEILGKASATKSKTNILIANMLHTIVPRMSILPVESMVEYTHVHTIVSYAINAYLVVMTFCDTNGQTVDLINLVKMTRARSNLTTWHMYKLEASGMI